MNISSVRPYCPYCGELSLRGQITRDNGKLITVCLNCNRVVRMKDCFTLENNQSIANGKDGTE